MTSTVAPVVEMREITMAFGSNQVLRGVDVSLHPGQVTAMLGANGAGKSTLIKILCGLYGGYGGAILMDGTPVDIRNPTMARANGIEVVHQQIAQAIVPGMSVAENLLFDRIVDSTVSPTASLGTLVAEARKVAAVLDLNWPDSRLRADVYTLPIADQQLILLARALSHQPKLLVLDEPTSALSDTEAQRLFGVIRTLRDRGVAVLYVSHRLGEIDDIADRLVVLRDGTIRNTYTPPFPWRDALHDMLGAQHAAAYQPSTSLRGERVAVSLRGVQLLRRSRPFDVDLRAGEVTAVFGLLGSGMAELAEGIAGATPLRAGSMTLDGAPFAPKNPAQAIRSGVFMVPANRALGTMIGEWSISWIASLPFLRAVSQLAVLQRGKEHELGRDVIDRFGVLASGPNQPMTSLSGGNQQKVAVGRWLRERPRVMVLHEPFQGVDVGARHDLSDKARRSAAEGCAVIVVTSDLEEAIEVADRILVLVDGNLAFDSYFADTSREEILGKLSVERTAQVGASRPLPPPFSPPDPTTRQ